MALGQQAGYEGVYNINLSDGRACADTALTANLARVTIYQRAALPDTTPAVLAQVDLLAQRIAAAARGALGAAGDAVPTADSLGVWLRARVRLPFVVVVRREHPGSWRIDTTSDTVSAKLNSLYAAVLRSIPPDSLWMIWPDGFAADSVAFRLVLVPEQRGQSGPAEKTSLFAVYSTRGLQEQPALLKQHQPVPRYPYDASRLRVAGEVLLQFVITADGRADTHTVKVLKPSAELLKTSPFAHYYEEFVSAATEAVRNYRFYPARVGTCPVRELVQFPFTFATRRSEGQ